MNCTRPVLERCKTGPVELVERPCGVCPACRAKKAQEWTYRLYAELKLHKKAVFVTLTYDDEHYKDLPVAKNCALRSLAKRDIQLFFKSLRDFVKPDKIRQYSVGEYGERTKRAHFHSIIFGLGPDDRLTIEKAWKKGFVCVGDVTPSSIAYVARYCTKKLFGNKDEYIALGLVPEFSVQSNRPGIGYGAISKAVKRSSDGGYFAWFQGRRIGAPRYFTDKIKSDYERLVGRFRSRVASDDRHRDYETSGKCEEEEQLQAERNRLATQRSRKRL